MATIESIASSEAPADSRGRINSNFEALASALLAKTAVTVGPQGSDYVTDGAGDDVQIQAALDAVGDAGGGVVWLRAGTYSLSEQLSIPSGIMLVGEGFATVIIAADGLDDDLMVNSDQVNGNENIVLRDFKLDGNRAAQSGGTGIYFDGTSTHSTNFLVENVWVTNTHSHGLHPKRTDVLRIRDCRFTDCGTSASLDHGIYLLDSDDAVIEGVISTDNAANGINAKQGTRLSVANCVARDNGGRGIRVADYEYVSIGNNVAEGNADSGIALYLEITGGVNKAAVAGNVCRNNRVHGVDLNNVSDVAVSGNDCSENKFNGIRLRNAVRSNVTGNSANGNSNDGTGDNYAGILVEGNSSRVAVVGNTAGNAGALHQKYGVQLADAADDILVTGNVLVGNQTAPYSNGSSGTNITETGNL
jgi:parallel beta-helix repeat protein